MDTYEELTNKMVGRIKNIEKRFNLIITKTDINKENNLSDMVNIAELLTSIEEKLSDLEGNINNLNNLTLEEKERIINQKILKVFTPYILYMKLHLFNN